MTEVFNLRSRRSSLPKSAEDDEDIEEEADEVVPDGVEEVEIERVNLEHKERTRSLLFDDIRKLSVLPDASGDVSSEKEGNLWMITCGRSTSIRFKTFQIITRGHCLFSLKALFLHVQRLKK